MRARARMMMGLPSTADELIRCCVEGRSRRKERVTMHGVAVLERTRHISARADEQVYPCYSIPEWSSATRSNMKAEENTQHVPKCMCTRPSQLLLIVPNRVLQYSMSDLVARRLT